MVESTIKRTQRLLEEAKLETVQDLLEKLESARKVIEFYAREGDCETEIGRSINPKTGKHPIFQIGGKRARQWLKENGE